MAFMSENNPQALSVSLLNSMIERDTLLLHDPLD